MAKRGERTSIEICKKRLRETEDARIGIQRSCMRALGSGQFSRLLLLCIKPLYHKLCEPELRYTMHTKNRQPLEHV